MNLIPFALFSQKIPEYYLVPQKKKGEHIKNLLALSIDQFILFALCGVITGIVSAGLDSILSTISSKYAVVFPGSMYLATFPLMSFTYYLVCLHCTDGMSIGMRMTKKRLTHSSFENQETQEAIKLTLTLISFGLTYPMIKNNFEKFDYRYESLMEVRDELFDLHALIDERGHEDQEDYQVAA